MYSQIFFYPQYYYKFFSNGLIKEFQTKKYLPEGLEISVIKFISFRNPSEISLQKSAIPISDFPNFISGIGL